MTPGSRRKSNQWRSRKTSGERSSLSRILRDAGNWPDKEGWAGHSRLGTACAKAQRNELAWRQWPYFCVWRGVGGRKAGPRSLRVPGAKLKNLNLIQEAIWRATKGFAVDLWFRNLWHSRKMVCGVCGLEAGSSRRPLHNPGGKWAETDRMVGHMDSMRRVRAQGSVPGGCLGHGGDGKSSTKINTGGRRSF